MFKRNKSMFRDNIIFILGIAIRVLLVFYSEYQDRFTNIKYTDIDYRVYTDAGYQVIQGNSPYDCHTYRYTPLIAWMMIPNILWWEGFGKTLFVLTDILCAYYLKQILALTTSLKKSYIDTLTIIWVFNPVVISVSSRGNADTLISLLVLLVLYNLAKKQICKAALIYGLAAHFKIYPLLYSLPIYFYINHEQTDKKLITEERMKFLIISASVFLGLFALFYFIYGYQFAFEAYFYHLIRKDNRHNFSPYFYYIYLNFNSITSTQAILTFLPQIILLSISGYKYYKDLPFCMFLQTFIFVMFNKVCTAQYFIWFFIFLPLIFHRSDLYLKKRTHLIIMGTVWLFMVCAWNLGAHLLEAQGINVFGWIAVACIAFFMINFYIAFEFIVNNQSEVYKMIHQVL